MSTLSKLLLALAGTGLLAPLAANAQDATAISSSAAISSYMEQQDVDRFRAWESQNQVTSVSQFSDVRPTDWAYQALSNLVERYGCVAGYPDGTFKGRVDTLEGKVKTLEAQQFSTTTKLRGEASFIIGGTPDFNSPLRLSDGSRPARPDQTTFNYDSRLSFDTSFTGKDLLRTRLRAGNFTGVPFNGSSQIFQLDKATGTGGSVNIDRLFYQFPVGKGVRVSVGPLIRNTEMLSFIPSAYKSDILDFFGLAGATGTYNKATGAGVGLSWRQQVEKGNPFITFDVNYVANSGFNDSTIGSFSSDSGINALAQLGIRGSSWGAAVAYRYGTQGSSIRTPNFSPATLGDGESSSSVSLAGYWSPIDASWAPSISAGYGYNGGSGGFSDSQSWMVGLQWSDVFYEGNAAGVAFGMPPFNNGNDSETWMLEVFYKYQVSDNVSITPAFFYASDYRNNNGFDTWGGVIQTTFRF